MWDQRYSAQGYAYGTEPNDFLVEAAEQLAAGHVLCLGEGEGRNAAWLAQRGMTVTAVDASAVGLAKAQALADEHGVSITTIKADLQDFDFGDGQWDAIVSIFCHLPPALRKQVHQQCVTGLRTGGIMLLEAYTPRQLELNTGGPPSVDMMMDSASLRQELPGLEFIQLQELEREIHEGEFHNGRGAVVQAVAMKPESQPG
jgi:SAM-dependent methyltransferase